MKCPHCGQPIRRRLGVTLPPTKAALFDAIAKKPVHIERLMALLYPGAPQSLARTRIAAHVNQLNYLIEETGFRVVGTGKRSDLHYTLMSHRRAQRIKAETLLRSAPVIRHIP